MDPHNPLQVNTGTNDTSHRVIEPWSVGFGTANELPPPPNQIVNDADLFAHALDRDLTLPPQVESAPLNLFPLDANGPLIHPNFQCDSNPIVTGVANTGALHGANTNSEGVLVGASGSQLFNFATSTPISTTEVQQRPLIAFSGDTIIPQVPLPPLPEHDRPTPNVIGLPTAVTTSAVTAAVPSTNSSSSGANKRPGPATSKQTGGRRKRARITNSKEDEAALAAANSGKADLTPEEQKRIRRVKNRASVEKCRHRQRVRFEALTSERETITKETGVLRSVGDSVRDNLGTILNQVAALSSGS